MLTRAGRARERGQWALEVAEPAVLAVSGGADSMVMADWFVSHAPTQVIAIATFDHGTGTHATASAELVREWAAARDIPFRGGRATGLPRREAAWRDARWAFLRDVSAEFGAPIATAHSEDDQAETVFIRLLRGSGVRGLAGLLAPGPVQRPLLGLTRTDIRATAIANGVPFREDPSNRDLRYLRNRVRLELLPRLEEAEPGFRDWLLALGRRAADWRCDVAEAVDSAWSPRVEGRSVVVPRARERTPTESEAALFWPEVAGRVGVALDWRGTARLASFTTVRASGRSMPLSGGGTVRASRDALTLSRSEPGRAETHPSDRLAPPEG
jgi:tRNA(Ile)-lysidine synthase